MFGISMGGGKFRFLLCCILVEFPGLFVTAPGKILVSFTDWNRLGKEWVLGKDIWRTKLRGEENDKFKAIDFVFPF